MEIFDRAVRIGMNILKKYFSYNGFVNFYIYDSNLNKKKLNILSVDVCLQEVIFLFLFTIALILNVKVFPKKRFPINELPL